MPIPYETYFLPPCQTAGTKALKDVTDAINFWVTPVDRWQSETVTPLPGCDDKDALIWSVEDVLQELALERCYKSPVVGWDARSPKELPIDSQYIDGRFQAKAKELGGGPRPDNVTLAEWLRSGVPKQPGHRPFIGRRFKDDLIRLIGQDSTREVLSVVVDHVLRDPMAALITKQTGAFEEGILRADLLEKFLPLKILEFVGEKGRPPSRREVRGVFTKAWNEVLDLLARRRKEVST